VRWSLRALPLGLLWLAGLFPVALWCIDRGSPLLAVQTVLTTGAALRTALLWGGAGALVLALLYPPFLPGARLLLAAGVDRLRYDRGPLLRALGELRHLETAARHLEAGRAALAIDDPTAALPHLVRAIELEPQIVAAHYQLGVCLVAMGHADRAIAPLRHVVEREPGHAFGGAMLLLGRCLMRTHDLRAAADVLARHAREHGGNRKSHFWLGQCLLAVGDRDGARAAFAVAAQKPPARPRLTADEAFHRARARVRLWRLGAPR